MLVTIAGVAIPRYLFGLKLKLSHSSGLLEPVTFGGACSLILPSCPASCTPRAGATPRSVKGSPRASSGSNGSDVVTTVPFLRPVDVVLRRQIAGLLHELLLRRVRRPVVSEPHVAVVACHQALLGLVDVVAPVALVHPAVGDRVGLRLERMLDVVSLERAAGPSRSFRRGRRRPRRACSPSACQHNSATMSNWAVNDDKDGDCPCVS